MKPVCTDRAKAAQNPIHQQFTMPVHSPFLEIRTTLESTLPYAEHFHASFSLGLILDGRTCLTLAEEQYLVEKGDVVFIPPGVPHRCNPIAPSTRSYHMAHIDANWFYSHVCPALGFNENALVRVSTPIIRAPALFAKALATIDTVGTDSAATGEQLIALFSAIQQHSRIFEANAKIPAHPVAVLIEKACLVEAMMVGQGPTNKPYSISRLAKAGKVRRETFSRVFRREVGMSPSVYLHCLRLEHARQMLRQGKSIAEAAAASGYVDQSHFHRMFVRYYSVTPGCYRKNRSHPYKK